MSPKHDDAGSIPAGSTSRPATKAEAAAALAHVLARYPTLLARLAAYDRGEEYTGS